MNGLSPSKKDKMKKSQRWPTDNAAGKYSSKKDSEYSNKIRTEDDPIAYGSTSNNTKEEMVDPS